ncbi:sialin-like [Copidosoma floridanum]|uniref:sialin-like n=1 Tax=Copidosoma floridanum TaxID=29053 RepID=UPI000C6F5908|nr:sialin-like [Copidosoma floridanum]
MVLPKKQVVNQTHERCFEVEKSPNNSNPLLDTTVPLYDWDTYTQGLILSSVFWAYGPMHFVYGPLIQRFGGKFFLGQAIFLPSLLTTLIPFAVKWRGSTALIALRFLFGLSSGAIYPAIGSMSPHWLPSSERTSFGIICAGYEIGTILGSIIPALIIKYSGYGWPAVFYCFGTLGVIWLPFWILLCYNNPDEHPFISDEEKKFLQDSTKHGLNKTTRPAPYRHILKSMPFWAFTMGLLGTNWTYLGMANDLPKFMKSLGLAIDKIGYVAAASYFLIWLNSVLSSWLVNSALSKGMTTVGRIRKAVGSMAILGPVMFIICASYAGCNEHLVVAAFVIGMTLMGFGNVSVSVNHLDLSPNFSGTLLSISNGLNTLCGVVSPYIVGLMTTNQTIAEWRSVFWINFAVAVVTCACFVAYGSGEIQYWNDMNFKRNVKTIERLDSL